MILLMPTWRGSHYPEGEAFLDTPYYKAFDSLLSSARLDALLEQYGYTLVFYPHIEMQKHLSRFHAPSEAVILPKYMLSVCAMCTNKRANGCFLVDKSQK